ncbi:cytochrome P450 [Phlegmacium glaucopus]|nr:cytochrome P450 [Phlegmacium glaucopus]
MQFTTDGLHMAMECANTGVWRPARMAFQMFLAAEAVDRHLPTQETASLQLLHDLLTIPEDLYTHIVRTTASLVSLVYGKCFPVFKDSEAEEYAQAVKLAKEVSDTTKLPPLEIVPWIKYIPFGWLRYLGATLMNAGAETSVSFLQAFVLALLSYPKYHKHIQNEIDTVIGSGRMPDSPDYETLSYLQAFVNEYEGYVIPKGSMLFMNTCM